MKRPYVVLIIKHKGNDRAVAFETEREAITYCEVQKMDPNTKEVRVSFVSLNP